MCRFTLKSLCSSSMSRSKRVLGQACFVARRFTKSWFCSASTSRNRRVLGHACFGTRGFSIDFLGNSCFVTRRFTTSTSRSKRVLGNACFVTRQFTIICCLSISMLRSKRVLDTLASRRASHYALACFNVDVAKQACAGTRLLRDAQGRRRRRDVSDSRFPGRRVGAVRG